MSDKPTATTNRRTILKAGATLTLAGFTASGSVIAQTDLPLELEQNAQDEYVIVRNVGDEDVDITGYQINFEAGDDSNQDQIRQLAGDVVIAPGEEVRVATGALEVSGDNVVQLTEPYERPELNNEDPDVVALLDPDDNVIVRSDGSTGGGDDDDDTDDSPTGTLTVTVEDGNGEPVDGIEVVGIGPDAEIYSGDTDENGQATFDLIDGDYSWHVTTDDTEYGDSSEEEITMDGDDESITLTVQADDDADDGSDDSDDSDEDKDKDTKDDSNDSDDSSGDDSDDSDGSDKSDDCPKR